jgi:hypothetical protein
MLGDDGNASLREIFGPAGVPPIGVRVGHANLDLPPRDRHRGDHRDCPRAARPNDVRGDASGRCDDFAPPLRHARGSSQASVRSAQAEMFALARATRGRRRVLAPRRQHTATPRRGRPLRRATATPAASAAGTRGSCFVDRPGPSHGTGAPGPPARDHETVMGIERKLGAPTARPGSVPILTRCESRVDDQEIPA